MNWRLSLCKRRVLALEKGIAEVIAARAAGEMGNLDKAFEHLEKLMAQR